MPNSKRRMWSMTSLGAVGSFGMSSVIAGVTASQGGRLLTTHCQQGLELQLRFIGRSAARVECRASAAGSPRQAKDQSDETRQTHDEQIGEPGFESTGARRLRISRRCSELIRQLESYSYPKKVRETDRGKRDPEKKDDDGPDALRYLAASYSAGISKSSEAIVYGRGDEVTGYGGKLTRTRSKDAPTGYISKQDSPGFVSYTR